MKKQFLLILTLSLSFVSPVLADESRGSEKRVSDFNPASLVCNLNEGAKSKLDTSQLSSESSGGKSHVAHGSTATLAN